MITHVQAMENERNAAVIRNRGDTRSEYIIVKGNRDMATIREKNVEMVMSRGFAVNFCAEKFFNKGCLHGRQFFITKFLDDDDDDNEK
jgi:hypothetical protein